MSNDARFPPGGRRPIGDRDVLVEKHRTPPTGHRAIPAEIDPESEPSSNYDIPEDRQADHRALVRSKRSTHQNIAVLQRKTDEHAVAIGEVKVGVAKMSGQLDTLVDLMRQDAELRKAESHADQQRATAIIDAADKSAKRRAAFWIAMGKIVISIITAIGIALAAYKAAK